MDVKEKKYNIGVRIKGYLDSNYIVIAEDLFDAIHSVGNTLLDKGIKTWKTRLISETDCYGKILRRGNGKFD